jgi:DHA2 family multidrug resistance protein
MGGDIGITLVTTLIIRRSQAHQVTLSQHATMWDPAFRARLAGLEAQLTHTGISPPTAHSRALATLYGQVQQQSTTLGYVDTVYVVGIMCACMVPLVFIMKRNTGAAPQGAH